MQTKGPLKQGHLAITMIITAYVAKVGMYLAIRCNVSLLDSDDVHAIKGKSLPEEK